VTGLSADSVLVTGGAGYIGSHACKALAAAGYRPVTYDSLVTGNRSAVRWGPFEHGDVGDIGRIIHVLQSYRPAAIMHFAASAYVAESVAEPEKYYSNNVAGTLALMQAARSCGVKKLVFSSTCAIYGEPQRMPIAEDAAQDPINPYGRSKLMIERILQDYVRAYGMSATALRYFNAAGADPAGEIGEDHTPETHLIPLVLRSILCPEEPVTVFGADYSTADGTCVRDFTHVSDIASAHVLALQGFGSEAQFRAFNLGTGSGHSVREILVMAECVSGKPAHAKFGSRRNGDPAELVADPAKARRELGWQVRHSGLREILSTAWSWMTRS
jgi:UDP-arabinose 4-epimerase